MRTAIAVNIWLPCVECARDLNGTPLPANCPDCGTPVRQTALQPIQRVDEGVRRKSKFHRLSALTGYPVDAFPFVLDVVTHTSLPLVQGAGRRQTAARGVVAAFVRRCRTYFADESVAIEVLDHWRLRSSEDVGRVIFAMCDVGLIDESADDRPEDFDGLFTLDTLFA